MADTTTDQTEIAREDAARFLRSIAAELEEGGGRIGVPVGNKVIQLSPPGTVELETTVTERSRRLRKDTEELSLTFRWNPTGDTAESGSGAETEPGTDL